MRHLCRLDIVGNWCHLDTKESDHPPAFVQKTQYHVFLGAFKGYWGALPDSIKVGENRHKYSCGTKVGHQPKHLESLCQQLWAVEPSWDKKQGNMHQTVVYHVLYFTNKVIWHPPYQPVGAAMCSWTLTPPSLPGWLAATWAGNFTLLVRRFFRIYYKTLHLIGVQSAFLYFLSNTAKLFFYILTTYSYVNSVSRAQNPKKNKKVSYGSY